MLGYRLGVLGCLLAAGVAGAEAVAGDASQHYHSAMSAAADRDATACQTALRRAIEANPDDAPARAELGQIRSDDRWVSARFAMYQAANQPALREYQELLTEADDTVGDHRRLARFGERNGLTPEARRHWIAVLQAEPQDPKALAALDSEWVGDRLVSRQVAREAAAEQEATVHAAAAWEERLSRLERRGGDKALAVLANDFDADAALPVERRIARLAAGDEGVRRRRRAIVDAYLNATQRLPGVETTGSLCRITTLAPDAEIRASAVDALAYRPDTEAVPQLLAMLRSPIQSEHKITQLEGGGVGYEHRLYAEGAETDQLLHRRHAVRLPTSGIARLTNARQIADAMFASQLATLRVHREAEAEARSVESRVAAYNAIAQRVSDRAIRSLEEVTKQELGDKPRAWWDYWQRETGYDVPAVRPIERTYDTAVSVDLPYGVPPPPPPRRCECFVAGTRVWTREGKMPIESLRAGDLVLSRDPHRGDLTYRVVTDTTRRDPSPMMEIVVGKDTIQTTVGHPFWVLGRGWRMAKQIAVGDLLSTTDGPLAVERLRAVADQTAYNLVVEGSANYYVGEQGLLVHDNTPRVPGEGLVIAR